MAKFEMENLEIQLVKNAQRGDHAAFEQLVRKHDLRVYQLAYGILGNVQEAQDIYQETFLRAWSKINTYAFDGPFAAWLNRISVNLSLNRLRQKQRWKWFELSSDRHGNEALNMRAGPEEVPDPERLAISAEIGREVNLALEELPAKQRAIFVMKHFHGLKISEISQTLDCAEGTVKNQLFRATQKLKAHFKHIYNEKLNPNFG